MSVADPLAPTYGDHTPAQERMSPLGVGSMPGVGARLANGRYEVMEKLGEGGMSIVLGAFDTQLARPVAIKVLLSYSAASRALVEEARITAAAPSPHVVAVYAVHLDEDPPFFVMERVYGVSLEARLAERHLDFIDALAILRDLASGLDSLHGSDLVHGDIKPSNVLIDRTGVVKIVDFGVAPLLTRVTVGEVFGTPGYMAPERARGLAVPEQHRSRTDVYSFAVLAYRVLTGRLPFVVRGAHELMRAHVVDAPPAPSTVSDLSPAFDAPLLRALAKDPADRHATAGELVRELDRAATGCTTSGYPLRILVVDDDDDHREMLSCMLAEALAGCAVRGARDGPEALTLLAAFAPNVAVVDLVMPGVAGVELLAEMRARAPSVGIVVVTGQGSGRERSAARQLGVRHFLIKPVESRDLSRAIAEAVDPAQRVESRA